MVRVELRLGGLIDIDGRELAIGRTFALLDAVRADRSVSGAAGRLGLSYRTAWGRIEALEAAFGQPLVTKTKGHGSVLSEAGSRLCDVLGALLLQFEAPIAAAQVSLTGSLKTVLEARPSRLTAAISHDFLMLDVFGGMPEVLDVVTMGSCDAVAKLLGGETDFAGFHFGGESPEPPAQSLFARVFLNDRFKTVPLFRREQGLIVGAENPLQIRSVRDLRSNGARFINRQRGSGTRLWFDRLLADAGLSPSDIRGYAVEEFTHQAIAAVVASGAADVGMGVRTAAERFGLSFIPLGHETYFGAMRQPLDDRLNELIATVQARASETTGYTSST